MQVGGDGREGAVPGGCTQLVSGDPPLSQHQPRCFSRLEFQISFSLWPLITPRGGGGWAREGGGGSLERQGESGGGTVDSKATPSPCCCQK